MTTRSSDISDWDFILHVMVADEVHIDTLSYKEGAQPVHWECDGGTDIEMGEGNRTAVGTEITLFLMMTAWSLPMNTE